MLKWIGAFFVLVIRLVNLACASTKVHLAKDSDMRYFGTLTISSQVRREMSPAALIKDTLIQKTPNAVQSPAAQLGHLPGLSVISSVGLLIIALSDNAARRSSIFGAPLFWTALLVIFVPVSWRLLQRETPRNERLGLVVLLGVSLYLVKLLSSPIGFTYHDELAFWASTHDIIQSHHLFQVNPIGRVYRFFPALQMVTSALVLEGHVSIFTAGAVSVLVGRLLLTLALFLFFERLSHSHRFAGIACLIYMTNPNFVFFDSQFAYESFALPIGVLVLFMTLQSIYLRRRMWLVWTTLTIIVIAGLVVTHHMTSYAFAALLVVWVAVSAIHRHMGTQFHRPAPRVLALVAVAGALLWLGTIAGSTVTYLWDPLDAAASSIIELFVGAPAGKEVFHSGSGQATPFWQQLLGFGSVILILLGLPVGLLSLWWRRHRLDALSVTLVMVTIAYPATLALRLTSAGTETSNRASEFLFLGVGFVIASGMLDALWLPLAFMNLYRSVVRRSVAAHTSITRRPVRIDSDLVSSWHRLALFTSLATVLFLGGIIVGWAPYALQPGAYLVRADPRSITYEGIQSADWAKNVLGPNNFVATDGSTMLLMGSYGGQRPQSGTIGGVPVATLFLSPIFTTTDQQIIQGDKIDFLVVDQRLSQGLPLDGNYFDKSEPDAGHHTQPISLQALTKFNDVPNINRIFDSGDIIIYDVSDFNRSR